MQHRTTILIAADRHFDWLSAHDTHLSHDRIRQLIALQAYLVAETEDGQIVGFLRFSRIWGTLPFMELIMVAPPFRRQNIGSRLLQGWETMMRQTGEKVIVSSSVASERVPQAWHRAQGFTEAGTLALGSFQREREVFFLKELR
ncbi:GNAT family N-acetyltransferase [uncultured Martelella sp.]|uniref:GNAT family N-acetyltransferase n=1 Tax=uncultured Martelella sp. TaxID=392331 RepID=UPI0029C7269F|nr:GNAT family N-acetyltransferase [uncultured Martelella sp.]